MIYRNLVVKPHGFTLIELLIIIAIIGVLGCTIAQQLPAVFTHIMDFIKMKWNEVLPIVGICGIVGYVVFRLQKTKKRRKMLNRRLKFYNK